MIGIELNLIKFISTKKFIRNKKKYLNRKFIKDKKKITNL